MSPPCHVRRRWGFTSRAQLNHARRFSSSVSALEVRWSARRPSRSSTNSWQRSHRARPQGKPFARVTAGAAGSPDPGQWAGSAPASDHISVRCRCRPGWPSCLVQRRPAFRLRQNCIFASVTGAADGTNLGTQRTKATAPSRPTTPTNPVASAREKAAVRPDTISGVRAPPASVRVRHEPRNGAGSSRGATSAPSVSRMPEDEPVADAEDHRERRRTTARRSSRSCVNARARKPRPISTIAGRAAQRRPKRSIT